MKTTPLDSFLKFYVMRSTQVDLYGIAHVKVDFILLQKMCVIPRLGSLSEIHVLYIQCGIYLNRIGRNGISDKWVDV